MIAGILSGLCFLLGFLIGWLSAREHNQRRRWERWWHTCGPGRPHTRGGKMSRLNVLGGGSGIALPGCEWGSFRQPGLSSIIPYAKGCLEKQYSLIR
jgi:hypothetical protein